ncbi:MAG: pyridoxal 5'-phosphate synthase glutaminase subunit PdxT [Actinomycetota bacterium]|nr:pyridoxal 5'-phosphate synthase glutaminase subunit PdxT [Actinomycetota bacterium]
MTTGILALQGSFQDHQKSLDLINKKHILIKDNKDLKYIDSLIIPGGESTSIIKIQKYNDLFNDIYKLIKSGIPTLGTCAGLIILAKDVLDGNVSLGILNCIVERNAYGRQNDSFEGLVKFNENTQMYCFIRAPKIISVGLNTESIAFLDDEVVGIKNNNIVGLTFHPELSNDDNYLNWLQKFVAKDNNVRTF